MRIQTLSDTEPGISGLFASVRAMRERFHTKARLEAILQRERARADRAGWQLSLVVFRITQGRALARTTCRLARTVVRRARITDDVGSLEQGSIAAVLPDTPGAGAWKFAHDVMEALGRWAAPVDVCVYTYPSSGPGDPWVARRPGSTGHGRGEGPAVSAGSVRRPSRTMQHNARGSAGSRPRGVRTEAWTAPLEPLLLCSIPGWKRAIDLCGAAIGLILLFPVLLVAGLAVKLSSRGPMLFVQLRTGRGGRPFRMYKLRTMHVNAERRRAELGRHSEQDGPAFKMRNDPRVTRIGRVLRTTSIDELPQLWNVIKGDMSLVGPRPLPCNEAEACDRWHWRRHDVLPGLTCIWQVRGRSSVSFDEWMRMDRAYIRSLGFLRDLLILLQTIPAVLMRRGAC